MHSLILAILSGLIGQSASASVSDIVHVGTLRLCRPTVTSASIATDQYTGEAALIVTLGEGAKVPFAKVTRGAVNSFLPITLNGQIIANPRISLEITGGIFQITGPNRSVLERVRSAMMNDC